MVDYFKNVDPKMLSELKQVYKVDFEMFGYDFNVWWRKIDIILQNTIQFKKNKTMLLQLFVRLSIVIKFIIYYGDLVAIHIVYVKKNFSVDFNIVYSFRPCGAIRE